MPKYPTSREAGKPPAGLKKAFVKLYSHPLSTDFLALSMIAALLIWGAFK